MSRHIVEERRYVWAFGWDQPLQSFYLQKYKKSHKHGQAFIWRGIGKDRLYEIEDLVRVAKGYGLTIDHGMQVTLYTDKDEGR